MAHTRICFILFHWLSYAQFLILVFIAGSVGWQEHVVLVFSGFQLLMLYIYLLSCQELKWTRFGRGNQTLFLCSDWQVSELAQTIKSDWWIRV